MKSLLPINTYEKSIIIGACALYFNEPILHFATSNLRKRLNTITKELSREKSRWLVNNFSDAKFPRLLLLFGGVIGADIGKLPNGIEIVLSKVDFDLHMWLMDTFTVKSIEQFCNDLMWMCDHNIILHQKKIHIIRLRDQITEYIPHFQKYADKVIGHLMENSPTDQS